MKRLLPLLLAALLLCGCGAKDVPSERSGPEEVSSYEAPPPPNTPPALPVEESEPQPEPLEEIGMTAEEAQALLVPDGSGVYRIGSKLELIAFAVMVNADESGKTFNGTILNDIDLEGLSFLPIGTPEAPYHGNFDGGGNILRGLTVREEGDHAGLFGVVAPGSKIEDTHVIGGQVSGRGMVGGIVGQCQGEIFACSFRGEVAATGGAVGGICGELGRGSVDLPAATLDQCGANVELTGNSMAGGLVGSAVAGSSISNSYARGSVTAGRGEESEPSRIGGLVGYANGAIKHCFTSLELYTQVGSRTVGAFLGELDGELVSCYYNMEPVENWKGVGSSPGEDPHGVRACTVEEITEAATFDNWNFVTVWSIQEGQNRGLPYLRVFMD